MQQHNMSWIEVCSNVTSKCCDPRSIDFRFYFFNMFYSRGTEQTRREIVNLCLLHFTVTLSLRSLSFQVQFLRKAVDVLCLCRNTLKYTYVFAFYLKKNNQSVIFEVSSCNSKYLFIVEPFSELLYLSVSACDWSI